MTRNEALDLFRSDDLIGLGMAADQVRRKLHPDGIVSYIIDRNINYTNFCTEYCSFCAFYRPMGHAEGYLHPKEVIFDKIQETLDLGGTGILMQGGLHPELKIEWYEDLLRSIKQRFNIWCHCFSAPEIMNIAKVSGLSLYDTLARLKDAGLDSLPGHREVGFHVVKPLMGLVARHADLLGRGLRVELAVCREGSELPVAVA